MPYYAQNDTTETLLKNSLERVYKSVFVLRQAQHERKILNDFHTYPVRPELVEG
jgi:hypothetical protein